MKLKSDKKGLRAVFLREVDRMISRPIYYLSAVVLPLFTLLFMATIFNTGQMNQMPIGIVDLNNTATSREIVRDVAAVPTFKITKRYTDQASARYDVSNKSIYGFLVIPREFEQRVMDNKESSLCFYYHYALLSVGGETLSGFQSVLQPISVEPIIEEGTELAIAPSYLKSFILPTTAKSQPLNNPDLDYTIYLSYPLFYVLFAILILLVTLYTFGFELKQKTAQQWLDTANGNIYKAMLGKMLPYSIAFIVVSLFANYIMFGPLHIPQNCGFLPLMVCSSIFVISTQCMGIFIYSAFPVLGIMISVASMIGSLGATLAGLTFPEPSMYYPIRVMSNMLPVRHFVLIYENLIYGDFGFVYTWQNYVVLVGFWLLPLVLGWRLKKCIIKYPYERFE